MTGGFLSAPIMRPNLCWTILAVMVLTLNADSGCETEIRIRRNTVYEVFLGQELIISFPVVFCNSSPPAVSWYKVEGSSNVPVNVSSSSHIKAEWKELNHSQGISYLIFQKILSSDSGLYRCRSGDAVSHSINVSVSGVGQTTTVRWENDTTSTTSNPEIPENILMYVYPAAGIVTVVIVVIVISIVSLRGCKGKSKKETQTENQYMAIPMVEQPFPHVSLQSSPRESLSVPPSRRSTRRKRPSSQPNELPPDNEPVYDRVKDRERQRNVVEDEGSSVVYAALNHQLPPGAAAPRPRRPPEEFSEYAAIRVS